jgi:hypothetical protein
MKTPNNANKNRGKEFNKHGVQHGVQQKDVGSPTKYLKIFGEGT